MNVQIDEPWGNIPAGDIDGLEVAREGPRCRQSRDDAIVDQERSVFNHAVRHDDTTIKQREGVAAIRYRHSAGIPAGAATDARGSNGHGRTRRFGGDVSPVIRRRSISIAWRPASGTGSCTVVNAGFKTDAKG